MNTNVNFETAKLLKEKGFDKKTNLIYNTEGELSNIHFWVFCSAPTIAEVVMWLYEKHGIWVIVDCDCYGELWYARLSVASKENWDDLDKRHEIISAVRKFPNEHKLPTEAYEAAITYTLNKLIKKQDEN